MNRAPLATALIPAVIGLTAARATSGAPAMPNPVNCPGGKGSERCGLRRPHLLRYQTNAYV